MNRRATITVAATMLGLLGLAGVAVAQNRQAPASPAVVKADLPGRTVFERQCAPCHGAGPGDDGSPMLPGTAALSRRYAGEMPGALELRDDLDGDALRLFVRNGLGAMPSFRKAELSDADVDAIAAYLKATAELSRGP